jgi:hypothetical protein
LAKVIFGKIIPAPTAKDRAIKAGALAYLITFVKTFNINFNPK